MNVYLQIKKKMSPTDKLFEQKKIWAFDVIRTKRGLITSGLTSYSKPRYNRKRFSAESHVLKI